MNLHQYIDYKNLLALPCDICGARPELTKVNGYGPDDWCLHHVCGVTHTGKERTFAEWNNKIRARGKS